MHHIFFPVFTLTSVNWGVPRQPLPRRCHRIRQGLLGVRIGPEFHRPRGWNCLNLTAAGCRRARGPPAPHTMTGSLAHGGQLELRSGARRGKLSVRLPSRAEGAARGRMHARGSVGWLRSGAGSVASGARRDVRTGGAVTSGRAMVRCEASAWRHDAVAQLLPQ